ncbi:DNA polymerase III subunit alpha [Candidatus Peregrinibacteria bacterium CG10_big_fil_rev_8_21_14_0_10_55_24]|nr:MAG: DNA polymerase III subunit alpha [Candidatus Peregrinibacteria bacterium CG10_big_fil_rev_8_21_14_0_10_55_24]
MKPEDFVHLHCHSTYSLLEGLPSTEEIVERAQELGHNAVGLADKGYTYGLVEFYKMAAERGVKPILGLETYVAARSRHDKESGIDTKRFPLVLFAETQEGYENLLCLATLAAVEGMYYKPRVDRELLAKYGKGLIALTGPLSGAIPQAALAEDAEQIRKLVEEYRSYFGKDNLYFELMDLPNVTGQAEVNQQLIHWGKELSVPLVVTCNSHYCRAQDAEAHDVLLCIQKNTRVDDPSRFSMRDSDFSMRPYEELAKIFDHVPEALENTRVITDRCSVVLEFGTYHIPRFPVPKGTTEESELVRLANEGLSKRYPQPTQAQKDRLEHEISVIKNMGFAGYFLIVADFVNEAKRRGIAVGPGRGSAAGSIVSYCLNITTLDPLEHGLLFERFLNPERITMPDIDMDFADTRRDEILEYVREKYGEDRVVQICTFGTLAARAAVKDVGRAYGIPFMEMNALAKLIPERPGTLLREALETSELKAAYESNETYRTIIDTALKLEGKARHVSVHACGVIITEEPTVQYTALQRASKDEHIIITQASAKPLEALGLLKMDFLGLTNLTVIQTALEIIERTRGEKVDIASIPLNDKKAFALLQQGDTTGVFQLESAGMRRYLKQLVPTTFNDITAMAALYRPGPMDWIPSFIKRKHGKEEVKFLHPDVEPIFRETYGIGVYQEQILQLARLFAGYSLGEADLLRRAIGKKIKKELDAQRDKFIAGAVAKKYERKLAEQIFDDVIMPFAGYGFPKAHAAGYARIAYETAYLKANYPAEFMAALLSSDAQRTDRVMIEIEECRAMGIEVLPPDINESLRHFTVVPGTKKREETIRFGLTAIKGIGDSTVQNLIAIREEGGKFTSIEDFARRIPTKILNKKLLESLAKSGAFDSLEKRHVLVAHYGTIIEFAKSCGDISSAQTDLFSHMDTETEPPTIEFPPTEDIPLQQQLQWEKETLGLYVSSHPLAGLKKYIGKKAQLIASLTAQDAGKKVTIAGIVESVKKITTKKGETMAAVVLEDPTGKIEATLFPRTFAEAAGFLEASDVVIVVGGTVDLRAGQLQIRASAVKKASLSTMIARAKEEGFFDEEEARKGLSFIRPHPAEEEKIELVDEEGNVVAGETVSITEEATEEFLGPLGRWLMDGANPKKALQILQEDIANSKDSPSAKDTPPSAEGGEPNPTRISIHTISLPKRAPKKLLLDLKKILETFPGKEKVQLKIGEQIIPLPLTVSFSTILEQKISETLERYSSPVP